jgi:hypothetical protein
MDASRFPSTIRWVTEEGSVTVDLLAIDLGKRPFHLYGVDSDGVVISRKVGRAKFG